MNPYELLDWRYLLPCSDRIPKEGSDALHPWFRSLLNKDEAGVRDALRKRWRDVPRWLRGLRDVILTGRRPTISHFCVEEDLLMLSWGEGTMNDLPWVERSWATSARFLPEKAREYLASLPDGPGAEGASGLSPSSLREMTYKAWAIEEAPDVEDLWASTRHENSGNIYLAPPPETSAVQKSLARVGLASTPGMSDFAAHFDALRQADPSIAGAFIPCDLWVTIARGHSESDMFPYGDFTKKMLQSWGDAVGVFCAANHDILLITPSGKVAWFVFSENRVDTRWDSFSKFIQFFAERLTGRYPLDSYSG